MKRYWIYQYLVLNSIALVICRSYYSVMAPGSIKSNRNYTVAVNLHEAEGPCLIRVSIESNSYNASQDVLLQPFESKQIDFMPQKLEYGDYKLIAEGISGLSFKNESILYVSADNGPKIYIQTDKAVYRPKDSVQFRVVILDQHTRPVQIQESIRVEILDHQNNRVKQLMDIALVKGVYTGSFQLSEQPVLGNWKIKVTISGKYSHSRDKYFKVLKYVLPKFSVHINTSSDIFLADGHIEATISGKYTFGKFVEGNATVELWDSYNDKLLEQKQIYIENLGYVEFHLENPKQFEKIHRLSLKADLTDKNSGTTQSSSSYITLRDQTYNIVVPNEEIEFRDNKPYRLKVHVKPWRDGTVLDRKAPVIMEHGDMRYQSYLDHNGLATFEFDHQPDEGHKFLYKDSTQFIWALDRLGDTVHNTSEYFCKMVLVERPRLGKPVKIQVTSIADIPYLIYMVVGHGGLVRMEHIKIPANKKSYTIKITPSVEMIPDSYIYVHYIHNGNFRYKEMHLRFPHELENQISVDTAKQSKPGQEVTITVKAQPKSYVSILAVDLGVYLLDSSYDLYKRKIIQDMLDDKTYAPIQSVQYPGVISGLITLTNGHYPFTQQSVSPLPLSASTAPLIFRTKFPETWIFQNFEINETTTQLTLKIPDTITTWRITAFSNNDITGFGIVDGPTDIIAFQTFFIAVNLPYSVKRGEIVTIPITIFNYHNQSLDTEVTMYNNHEEFEFMDTTKDTQKQMKQVKVPFDGGKTVTFIIKTKKAGEINLSVSATNSLFSDAVEQKLRVEPEGITRYHNQAVYISVPPGETLSSKFAIKIPLDSVPDSEFITLSAGGDFIVPSLENLNDLVKMPTGCGEQNMVNFVPNILIIQYLKVIGKFNQQKKLVKKSISYIEIGYQQQLSFRHRNGGYSVFGEKRSKEASTWLTAYVVRFFMKASKYIAIESRIIETGLQYLASEQLEDGEFDYTGYLFDPAHQNEYGFTAFVLLTFLEDPVYAKHYEDTIQSSLKFIDDNLDDIYDIYALSIIATALKMAKHANANKVIDRLRLLSKSDDKGNKWWSGMVKNKAKDVEITSYVLMALLDAPENHFSILKWLIEQRNSNGGFKSSHDTVVGLQALVAFSQKYNNLDDMNLNITYSAKDSQENQLKTDTFLMQQYNILVLQQHELPKSTRQVSLKMQGTGHSFLQLSYQYNVLNDEHTQNFLIEPNASLENSYKMLLKICFTYKSQLGINNSTNMVIMEANLPSGFRSDAETSLSLIENEFVQRIEAKNEDSTIILYLDNISVNLKHCVNIGADKVTDVSMRKPVAVIMYDYYDTNRKNSVFYNIK